MLFFLRIEFSPSNQYGQTLDQVPRPGGHGLCISILDQVVGKTLRKYFRDKNITFLNKEQLSANQMFLSCLYCLVNIYVLLHIIMPNRI